MAPLPAESEAHFQAEVLKLAKALGWWAYHTHDSRRSAAGFPDLVLARLRDKRLIFAELKRDKGMATWEQTQWLNQLRWCGAEAYLWRPRDWSSVVEILTGGRPAEKVDE